MVYVKFDSGKEFYSIMKGLSNVFPGIVLKFNDDGMCCSMIDLSRTFMVRWNIPSKSFSEYDVDGEKTVMVNLEKLIKSKFKVGQNDSLVIKVDYDKSLLTFRAESREGRIKEFRLKEYMLDDDISDLVLDKDIELNTDVFAIVPIEILKEAVTYDLDVDILTMIGDKDGLIFERVEDGDICAVRIQLEKDTQDLVSYDFKGDGEVRSQYTVKLLKTSLSVFNFSSFVALEFSKDSPLIMSADNSLGGMIKLFLAPVWTGCSD